MRAAERGAITVEAAIALSALTLVVLAALGSLGAVAAAVRCQDAARELARLAARGDLDRARGVAAGVAPPGAEMAVDSVGDEIRVTVRAAPVPLLPIRVSGSALALREPGATADGAFPGGGGSANETPPEPDPEPLAEPDGAPAAAGALLGSVLCRRWRFAGSAGSALDGRDRRSTPRAGRHRSGRRSALRRPDGPRRTGRGRSRGGRAGDGDRGSATVWAASAVVVVLTLTVVSFPLLLDRDAGAAVAITTSLRAIAKNPVTMVTWGIIVAGLLLLGALPFFVGLAVVIPVLGHATWHLYRKLVEFPDLPPLEVQPPSPKGRRYAADFPAALFPVYEKKKDQ